MRVVMVDPGAFTPFHDDALCRALVAEGCEVELVTAPFAYHSWPQAIGYARRERFASGGGEAGALRSTLRRLRRVCAYPLAWRRIVRELESRPPAVVHLQWSLLPAVERLALGRLRAAGVAVVQTLHNAREHRGEALRFSPGGPLCGRVDAWVVHSEATAKRLLDDHPALAGRVRVVRPGIEGRGAAGEAGEADRLRARKRLGLDTKSPLAVFLGLIRPYKGLDLLLEAFAAVLRELPDARLVVAGLPRPSFREPARQIERLGLGERVTTDLRYLPQSVMDDYLTAADLVVLPYRDASQSAVLGAALGCDRPVVASAVGGLPEMLAGAGEEMLVPPGDVAALADRIRHFLGHRAVAAELGRRAGEAARRRFSWPEAAAVTAALYREVTPGAPLRPDFVRLTGVGADAGAGAAAGAVAGAGGPQS